MLGGKHNFCEARDEKFNEGDEGEDEGDEGNESGGGWRLPGGGDDVILCAVTTHPNLLLPCCVLLIFLESAKKTFVHE